MFYLFKIYHSEKYSELFFNIKFSFLIVHKVGTTKSIQTIDSVTKYLLISSNTGKTAKINVLNRILIYSSKTKQVIYQ